MLKLLRNKKAQNTAEYALLFAVVIGAFSVMQMYMRRGINARIKDGVNNIPTMVSDQQTANNTGGESITGAFSASKQYEPYYVRGGSVNMTTQTSEGTETGTIKDTGGTRDLTGATSNRSGTQETTGTQEE